MATAAPNRPQPTHPGQDRGGQHPQASGPPTGPVSWQQVPGLHGNSQDPGPLFHHISPRPLFYLHTQPPPPFLPYQWPMPFSYNPYGGFSGMGYGVVMPQFPTPPYMDTPAYILPHPHMQSVDYRRLFHPQVSAAQNLRTRPGNVPVRETVNSEVQTELTPIRSTAHRTVASESGHGTASNSPSSSSSSQRQECEIVHSYISATSKPKRSKEVVGQTNAPQARGTSEMWSVCSTDGMVPVCTSSDREDEVTKGQRLSVPDILSWGDGVPQMTPHKTADEVFSHNDKVPSCDTEVGQEKPVYQSPADAQNDEVVTGVEGDAEDILISKDNDTLFKILKLPFSLQVFLDPLTVNETMGMSEPITSSLPSISEIITDDPEQENGNDETMELVPYQMSLSNCQMRQKINESVWSVESLAPYIPSKEWLMQNGIFEPDLIMMAADDAENESTENHNFILAGHKDRKLWRSCSLPDNISEDQPSKGWFNQCRNDQFLLASRQNVFVSSPAENRRARKEPGGDSEIQPSDAKEQQKQSLSMADLAKESTASTLQRKVGLTPEQHVKESGFSEPEANPSPNQEAFNVTEQQEESPCSPERVETLLLNSTEAAKSSSIPQPTVHNGVEMEQENGMSGNAEEIPQDKGHLCVQTAKNMAEVSPSKGHLVDCGIQCSELKCFCEELKSNMEPNRHHLLKISDKVYNIEGFPTNAHLQKNHKRHGQRKNRGPEKQLCPYEAFNGYCSKPGKAKGGNVRNLQY